MHTEIQIAAQFLSSYIPSNEQQQFIVDLQRILFQKFTGHWYISEPQRGSAFRSIKIHSKLDPLLSSLQKYHLEKLPSELVLWIDPGCVSYRIGSNYIITLYGQEKHRQIEKRPVRMAPPLSPPHSDVSFRVEAITA